MRYYLLMLATIACIPATKTEIPETTCERLGKAAQVADAVMLTVAAGCAAASSPEQVEACGRARVAAEVAQKAAHDIYQLECTDGE